MIRIVIVIAFILFCAATTVCRPEILATNEFLRAFISHEILALLAVILTITLASVANIHLSLNRIVKANQKDGHASIDGASKEVRAEINTNAWLLFWGFVVCIAALFFKGAFSQDVYVVSAMHGIALTVLLVNILVLHDIYQTTFKIVEANLPER